MTPEFSDIANHCPGITAAQAQFFDDNGYLVLQGLLAGDELQAVDRAMAALVSLSEVQRGINPDYMFAKGAKSGNDVLRRIEYVVDKSDAMKALLGHPYILHSVQRLMGPHFIPTWDSMVVKMPGEGVIVPWHRDDELEGAPEIHPPVFNVDIYLDDADLGNCLWVIPQSHKWSKQQAQARVGVQGNPAARVERLPFSFEDAVAVPLKKGDVIFHNVKLVHGSPDGEGNKLRRTVYYEFRPLALEQQIGPHNAAYLHLKQQVLKACILQRSLMPYAATEQPYPYEATTVCPLPLQTFRVEHAAFPFVAETTT